MTFFFGDVNIECEVTPPYPLREYNLFGSVIPNNFIPQRSICVYGPWVIDHGNGDQQEIHPTEAIWFPTKTTNLSEIDLFLIQDASIRRFSERIDFLDPNRNELEPGENWVPWVENPQTEEIKIPFQFISQLNIHALITLKEISSLYVTTVLFPELSDSDDGNIHRLKINGQTVVEVREDVTKSANSGVQFKDICKSSNGNNFMIHGNVVIYSSMGRVATEDRGFHHLRIKFSSESD